MALHTIVEHDSTHIKPYIDAVKTALTGKVVDSEPYVLRQGLGNLADMNLVGGSVAWNQLIKNGNFVDTINWNNVMSTFSVSNNVGKFTASAQWGRIQTSNSVNYKANHIYLGTVAITGTTDTYFDFSGGIGARYCHGSSREVISALVKPSSDANGNPAVGDRRTSGWTEVKVENMMIFDLTQMFGSTIADYIYSLEQATAGAGVAWFRKYFPNAYYGNQSGKIESVNVASRKVVGKNFIKGLLQGSIDTYGNKNATSSNRICTDEYIKVFPNTSYRLSASSANIQAYLLMFDSIGNERNNNPGWTSLPYTFPMNSKAHYCRIMFRYSNDSAIAPTDINVQFEFGTTATEYEPYQEHTFLFASDLQLRGIPKLVDNKLSYDGDTYTADGTVTRKYAALSFDGDEAWRSGEALANVYRMAFDISPLAKNSVKEISNYLPYVNNYALDEEHFYIYNHVLYVFLKATNETEFKAALASKPLTVIYELATPTTESANAYQNPQRAFIDGTEEFVDYGVQSATRDVSIPVGNNTTYQLNETLPPTEDYVDGALKFKAAISVLGTDESGRTTASRAYTTGEFFYKDGKMYKVLASIASGATFTVGTNCQQTTLFAELKALAQ